MTDEPLRPAERLVWFVLGFLTATLMAVLVLGYRGVL